MGAKYSKLILRPLIMPSVAFSLWSLSIISLNTLKLSIVGFILLFVVCPLFWKFSTFVQKSIIFLNYVRSPINSLDFPEKYGMEGTRNFYLRYRSKTSNDEVKLGVWHILPEKFINLTEPENSSSSEYTDDGKTWQENTLFNKLLFGGDTPVILYAHGNSLSRGDGHRLELYKLLQSLQYHIIAFDYRGFGDSTWLEVSELGLVEDTITVYKWILENFQETNTAQTPIYIWGHSLGTGISMHAFSLIASEISLPVDHTLEPKLRQPNGIILESPFNNLSDELHEHFIGKIFSWLPWFKWMIIDAIHDNNITFRSDEYITAISSPILILHAKDDFVIPHQLGNRLYISAMMNRPSGYGKVELLMFESSLGLGHKYICRSKIIPGVISDFIRDFNEFKPPSLENGDWQCQENREEREIILY